MTVEDPSLCLTILSPCYRDENNIEELCRRLTSVCQGLGVQYEILLVDDGSPDGTWEKILCIARLDAHIGGIKLSRNFGHQIAVTAGLSKARGNRVLIIDSDLQDPPELLPQMMKLMDGGADNVYGRRQRGQALPIAIANFLTSFLMSGRPAAAEQYRQTRPGSPM